MSMKPYLLIAGAMSAGIAGMFATSEPRFDPRTRYVPPEPDHKAHMNRAEEKRRMRAAKKMAVASRA